MVIKKSALWMNSIIYYRDIFVISIGLITTSIFLGPTISFI